MRFLCQTLKKNFQEGLQECRGTACLPLQDLSGFSVQKSGILDTSNIQIFYIQGIGFDEIASRFNLIAHEHRKYLIRFDGVVVQLIFFCMISMNDSRPLLLFFKKTRIDNSQRTRLNFYFWKGFGANPDPQRLCLFFQRGFPIFDRAQIQMFEALRL